MVDNNIRYNLSSKSSENKLIILQSNIFLSIRLFYHIIIKNTNISNLHQYTLTIITYLFCFFKNNKRIFYFIFHIIFEIIVRIIDIAHRSKSSLFNIYSRSKSNHDKSPTLTFHWYQNCRRNKMLLVSFTAFNHFTKANKVNPSWAAKRGCITISRLRISENRRFSPCFKLENYSIRLKRGLITVTRESYRTRVSMWRWNNYQCHLPLIKQCHWAWVTLSYSPSNIIS